MSEIHIVYWEGDEDCGGRNDGPIAAFSSWAAAWAEVRQQAEEEAMRRGATATMSRWTGEPIDWGDEPGIAVEGERCSVRVKTLTFA